VYWLDWDGAADPPSGTILAVAQGGGDPRPLGESRNSLAILRTDGSELFWTDHRDDYRDGVLHKVPNSGGEVLAIAEGLYLASALALDDSQVYFGTVAEAELDGIARVPKSGGEPELLVDGRLAGDMLVAGDEFYWIESSLKPSIVEPLYDRVVSVFRADLNGGFSPRLLTELQGESPLALVVTDDYVFWTFGLFDELWRVGRDGSDARAVMEGGPDTWWFGISLATDGANVYFSRYWHSDSDRTRRDALVRCSLDGLEVQELARVATIVDVAVDERFVYFTGEVWVDDSLVSGVFRLVK
jgi:hypothetical protein